MYNLSNMGIQRCELETIATGKGMKRYIGDNIVFIVCGEGTRRHRR